MIKNEKALVRMANKASTDLSEKEGYICEYDSGGKVSGGTNVLGVIVEGGATESDVAIIGDGVGGFKDTHGNPYPPFAYSSGMGWVEVTAEECERLGLAATSSKSPYQAGSSEGRAVSMKPPSLSPGESDIADAIRRYGFPNIAEGLA